MKLIIFICLILFPLSQIKADEIPDIFQAGNTIKFVKADDTNMHHILISEVKGKWIGLATGHQGVIAWYNTDLIFSAIKTTEPAPPVEKRKLIKIPVPSDKKELQAPQANIPTNVPAIPPTRSRTNQLSETK